MTVINNDNIYQHIVVYHTDLFSYLKDELVISYRLTNSLIDEGNLLVNNKVVKKNIKIYKNDIITILFIDESNEYAKQNISFEIVYESCDLLIINKQPNIVVHPTKSHQNNTIANGIAFYFDKINLKRKIRFVNRLDMDTSGLLVIAKNAYAHQFLARQFDENKIIKKYYAIVNGHLPNKYGEINKAITKLTDSSKYAVDETGKDSVTIYKVVNEYRNYSLVECELKSGRTHQIRLHLASLGTPIIGDSFYYEQSQKINRLALHAYYLKFIEPRSFKEIEITCDLPVDMQILLDNSF